MFYRSSSNWKFNDGCIFPQSDDIVLNPQKCVTINNIVNVLDVSRCILITLLKIHIEYYGILNYLFVIFPLKVFHLKD